MSKITWSTEKRLIIDIKPAEYNPRTLTDAQKEQLSISVSKFNIADPIIINKNNNIIGGHQRVKVLIDLGVEEVDVRVPDRLLTEEEEKELNLRLNKNLGEWDWDLLEGFSSQLLLDVGFSDEELDQIFKVSLDPEEKDDAIPDTRETDIKLGDMFQLGEHRLLCGDATKSEDAEKLMQGEKADMVFTDPPYGVGYEKKANLLGRKGYSKVSNDESLSDAELIWEKAFKNIGDTLSDGGSYYLTAPQGGDQMMMMMMMMMKNHIPCKHELIWVKKSPVFSMGRLDYDYQHEPILYGWKGSHKFNGAGSQKKSIWQFDREKDKLHPTIKPVELIINAIMNSTQSQNNIVIDFFGGSGSTLIACEKTNRKCRMMELDPIYCQVIIDRWEDYTGGKAEKID